MLRGYRRRRRIHGLQGGLEASVLEPETVGGVGVVDGLLELDGAQAENDVVDGVLAGLDEHGSSEGFQEVGLVNTVDTLVAKGFFNLRMLGDVTDTENHGQDNRAGLLAVVNTVAGHGVQEAVGGRVVALARGTEGTGGGTGGEEEVQRRVGEDFVEFQGTVDLGAGTSSLVVVGHGVEQAVLSKVLVIRYQL